MISLNLRTTDVLEEVNDLRSLIDSLQVSRIRVFLLNHEDAWSLIWKRSCGAFCACGQVEIMLCLCLLFSFTFLSRFAFERFPFAFALGGVLFVFDFPFAFALCLVFPLLLPLFLFTELCRHTTFLNNVQGWAWQSFLSASSVVSLSTIAFSCSIFNSSLIPV